MVLMRIVSGGGDGDSGGHNGGGYTWLTDA